MVILRYWLSGLKDRLRLRVGTWSSLLLLKWKRKFFFFSYFRVSCLRLLELGWSLVPWFRLEFVSSRQVRVYLLEPCWNLSSQARSKSFIEMGWNIAPRPGLEYTPWVELESKLVCVRSKISPLNWLVSYIPWEGKTPISLRPSWQFLELGLDPYVLRVGLISFSSSSWYLSCSLTESDCMAPLPSSTFDIWEFFEPSQYLEFYSSNWKWLVDLPLYLAEHPSRASVAPSSNSHATLTLSKLDLFHLLSNNQHIWVLFVL